MIGNNEMAATEAVDPSATNEGEEIADTSDTSVRSIPYDRFSTVVKERNQERATREALEKQLSEYTKTQPQKQVEQTQEGKFKDNYTSIDEFYGDITKKAASDDAFLDKLLDALYDKKGDKFDEVLFNSLTRKNQKVMQEQEDIQTKMEREQDEKLDRIESDFGTDVAGFDGFKNWVTEILAKENVPNWARDIDSLHDVYKEYIYQKPQASTAAKKISRSKVGGKVVSTPDLSGDIHDVMRGLNAFE